MFETARGLKDIQVVVSGGVDEISAVTHIDVKNCVQMVNFRVSPDTKRIEKRGGLELLVNLGDGYDVYGYGTYYDASNHFCQLAVTKRYIWRNIAGAGWVNIHTFASPYITHPVKIFEIQKRIYVLTELENVMLLASGSGGTEAVCGIVAPTTLPTVAVAADSTLVDESFAAIGSWADEDAGGGASSIATIDSQSSLRLLCAAASGDIAKRSQTFANFGPELSLDMHIWINTIGIYQDTNYFQFDIYNGRVLAQVRIDKNDMYVYSGQWWVACGITIDQDAWMTFRFYFNTNEVGEEYVAIFKNDWTIGEFIVSQANVGSTGKVILAAYGNTVATDVYIDYIKMGTPAGGNLMGKYRYAIAYERGGNYGGYSNPIKSLIGTITFSTAPGLNDLTITGTYAGDVDRTIVVYCDTGGAGTNTFKWSEDGGVTWNSTLISMAAVNYLNYGIELNWAAVTGHTATNTWTFTCRAMAAVAVHQCVTLSSLPVSGDSQVTLKDIYRTTTNGALYYLAAQIPNAQTTWKDNVPDGALGLAMREDWDIPPVEKFAQWWDDRLWIADADENIVYYSDINFPEAFDLGSRFVSFRVGDQNDKITGIIPYKEYLYVFKRKSIFYIRKKAGGVYGRYLTCKDFGCIAPWSLHEAYGLLMFLSYRGWEVFNGCEGFANLFSLPVDPTIKTIDKSKPDLICAVHNRAYNEMWLSTPDRLLSASALTFVVNYQKGQCFYYFQFHQVPSCLVEACDSAGELKIYMGTRVGYIYTCDTGTQDGTTNIAAYARIPWIKLPIKNMADHFELEFEAPTGITLTSDFYADFQAASVRTTTHTGATPSSADILRKPISDEKSMKVNFKYLSWKFANAQNVGAALKINSCKVFFQDLVRKNKITPD